MKERILNIETVHQCNCCLGCKTLHPLVSVIDLSKTNLEQQIIKFDFYTILMMEGEIDDILYGRKYYDYSNASLVFLTPGESIKINKSKALPSKGWLLAFHPDLISQTSLGEHIKDYSFFFLQSGGGTPPISTGEGQGCRMHMQHRRGTSSCDRLPQPNSDFTVHRIVIRSLQPFLRTSVYHTLRS